MDYFEFAKQLSRERLRQVEEQLPPLSAEEHRWIELKLGRPLSNDEAQQAIKDAALLASWEVWLSEKRPD